MSLTIGSCFAGIGGFDLGFERAGFEVIWHAEKDAQCRRLLAAKWPAARTFEDVHQVTAATAARPDIICGGFPCQDLSVAGKRAGLQGARSGLFYQLTRITYELQPALLIWENVPGLLSSNNGHDFLAVLTELRRIGYNGGWRTFDAQHFGVAQRRRRVFGAFARRDIGAGGCAEILSLIEGMRGHPAPSKGARQKIAGTVTPSALGNSSPCGGDGREGMLVTGTLGANHGNTKAEHAWTGQLIPGTLQANGKAAGSATNQDAESDQLVELTLLSHHKRLDPESETIIAFNHRQDPDITGDVIGPIQSACPDQAVAFKPSHFTRDKDGAPPLSADADKGDQEPVVFQERYFTRDNKTGGAPSELADITNAHKAGDSSPVAVTTFGVRRLTPRECERLQGFPDDWTAGFSDSVRYRMLGNAVAVPNAEWLAHRIAQVLRKIACASASDSPPSVQPGHPVWHEEPKEERNQR